MRSKANTLDALTGLRWLAAFAVFVHHLKSSSLLEFKFRYALGSPAVSFFFVLSGFILTYVYSQRWDSGKVTVKKFYFTRWARIWPLHMVCLLIFIVALFDWRVLLDNGEQFRKFLTNLALLQSWTADSTWVFGFNGVSWSISTELFFYLAFPFLLVGGPRKFWVKYVLVILLTLLLVTGLSQLARLPSMQAYDWYRVGHVNPLIRLPEFCTGMAVGFLFLKRETKKVSEGHIARDTLKELASLALMGTWIVVVHALDLVTWISTASWGGVTTASWFRVASTVGVFGLTIYVFAGSRGIVSRLMSTRPLVFLGEVSYAFYMIHMIVILAVKRYVWPDWSAHPLSLATCAFLIALGMSILLYKLIEMPAKAALLTAYDRQFRKSALPLVTATWRLVRSPLGWTSTAIILMPAWYLSSNRQVAQPFDTHHEIALASQPDLRGVRFGNAITLLGCQVVPKAKGIELQMLWVRHGELRHRRFINILSHHGKIVGHGRRNDQAFANSKPGEEFVDSVFIPRQILDKGLTIGIGFYRPGDGMLIPKSGPRTANGRRLEVVTQSQFQELVSRMARDVKVRSSPQTISR